MSDNFNQDQTRHEHKVHVQPILTKFQEVPEESEADAVRDAFLQSAGMQLTGAASALNVVDATTRTQVVNRLQEERGNAYVKRVVSEGPGTPGRLVGLSQNEMVAEVLQRKGSGSPLTEPARGQLEGHFGADLGGVQVHADGEADALNRELNAQAFTVGSDIFFANGQYNPSSREGQGLLAHELAHVAQQTGLTGNGVQRQAAPEEEEEQVQRQAAPEEEEPKEA